MNRQILHNTLATRLTRTVFRLGMVAPFAVVWAFADVPAAPPGTVNAAEGQVLLDGHAIVVHSAESVNVRPGQVIETEQGKVEVLLTTGVFLRMEGGSAFKMIERSANRARVEVTRGEALVDVEGLGKYDDVTVVANEAAVRLVRAGVYEFRAADPAVMVYAGKARAQGGGRRLVLGPGKELKQSANGDAKAQSFDRSQTDDLYNWSHKRSDEENDAAEWLALYLPSIDPDGQFSPGWHWSPWLETWLFVTSDMLL
jgi:hypothetical protein